MMEHEKGAGFTARVVSPFKGVPDGEIYPRVIGAGEKICGDLARVAVENGWAKSLGAAPENKAISPKNPVGPTGEDKPSSSRPAGRAKGKTTSKKRAAKPSSL